MLTYLAALSFPNIDAVAFEIGPFTVKWYGLAYMSGLLLGWWYVRRLIGEARLWHGGQAAITSEQSDDLLLWITLAVIVGGRLGQVLLYDPDYYFHNPAEIIKTWKGGMSFHGALIASGLALLIFARNMKVSALSVMDLCCASVPFGLFLGRLANFINSEHWGRVAPDVSWAVLFPNGGDAARHPSQLYEAALEGLVMFVVMRFCTHKLFSLQRPGFTAGVWLVWYAIARTICEFFRQPEPAHALNLGPFTAGQMYSIPMLLLGLYLILQARSAPSAPKAAL